MRQHVNPLSEFFQLPLTLPSKSLLFKEPDYPKTTQDEIAMNSWLIENDMTTKAQLLVKYNKDYKKIGDPNNYLPLLNDEIKVILNPIHDRMIRPEMKPKREYLSKKL